MSEGTESRLLPDSPNHRHNPLYNHLVHAVGQAEPGRTPEQRANLAAGLLDSYLQSRPAAERDLRLDETTIRSLQVVAGKPDASTPSLFVVAGNHREGAPLISTPLATADAPASQTLERYAQQRSIGQDGYLTAPGITRTSIPALEREPMSAVNAIVLHRTEGPSLDSALSEWRKSHNGTHFIIDKNGLIHQTASLNHHTNHVGRIRSRAEEEGTASAEESKELKGYGVSQTHSHENTKSYPDRFPTNRDSVGIEVVANYNKARGWDVTTPEQKESLNRLVDVLKCEYGLSHQDIYEHDKISYKTQDEGNGLIEPNAHDRDPAVMQQRSGPTR